MGGANPPMCKRPRENPGGWDGKLPPVDRTLTSEILTSKQTFMQGVSEKLFKNEEHKSLPEHKFIWR